MRHRGGTVEQELARIAESSHGVVTRAELLRAGVKAAEIKRRVRTGALLREHRGVYRVGHRAPSIEARYLAAVRACGAGSRLRGRAAGCGVLHGTTPAQVEAVLLRCRNSPGATKLRPVMRGEVPVTLSGLERRFLALLRDAGLPPPRTKRPAGGRRVDCRWPEHQLTVELDSYRYHNSRHAWEQDRRREREAHARGDEFRRYTHGDVFDDSEAMMGELRHLLPARRPSLGRAEHPRAGQPLH